MDTTLIVSGGILLGCIIGLSWFAGSDAPYIPTKMNQIRKILKLAGVKRGKKFYELGSGDGRVVFEAARLHAESIGIEQSWLRVLYSRWKAQQLGLKKIHFKHGNIFNDSFWQPPLSLRAPKGRGNLPRKIASSPASPAPRNDVSIADGDIVYIFLLHKGVRKLEGKLKQELKKGSVVITQTYHFPNWKPFKKEGDFWLYRR